MNQIYKGKYQKTKSANKDGSRRRSERRTQSERREADRAANANQPILTQAEIAMLLRGSG